MSVQLFVTQVILNNEHDHALESLTQVSYIYTLVHVHHKVLPTMTPTRMVVHYSSPYDGQSTIEEN